jgi:hypothetical protein
MYPDKVAANQQGLQEQEPVKLDVLKPVKSFTLDLAAISGEPIFGGNNEGATRGNDTLEGLIEAEEKLLQSTYDGAKGETQPVGNFLQLVNGLAGKKRIKRHAPLLVQLYSELLVAKVGKGQLPVAEKMFFNFMENIHPAVQSAKYEALAYNLSVIASQGLIMTVATKNDEIRTQVFGKLLGDKFDIATHPNPTLIYNLACYYATIGNKADMLVAIKQARKRKKPARQFTADTDFKSYWKDADFLAALKD